MQRKSGICPECKHKHKAVQDDDGYFNFHYAMITVAGKIVCIGECLTKHGIKLVKAKREKERKKADKVKRNDTAKRKQALKSIGELTGEAAVLLQKLRRLEESDDNGYCACVTCGVVKKWNRGMHGGHFRPRGKSATKLDKNNIWPQCDACNGDGMKYHGKEAVYTMFLTDKFGAEFVQALVTKSMQKHKWDRLDIEMLMDVFKAQIKEQQERVGN